MTPNDVGIVAKVVADAIRKATAPLHAEIATLKQRQPDRGEKGDKGEPGESIVGPIGPAGKDADPVDLDALALKAAELIPVPTRFSTGLGQPEFSGKDGDVYLNVENGEVYEWR